MDPTRSSARALAAAVRAGELSAVEVLDAHAARIEQLNPALNAIVAPRLDDARRDAVAADRAIAAGEDTGALHGVPFTVKEAIAAAGMPWTAGSRLRAGEVATADAPAVARLRRAGAILLGVTNVPEFCMYYDSDCDVYGRTVNPHDASRTSGGSSGGESAALAARLTPLGLGSDLGSSIRQPAAWTGVTGIKPSRGLVPYEGHGWFGIGLGFRAMGSIGPMARTVADLLLALEVLSDYPIAATAPPGPIAVFEEDGLQPVAAVCRDAVRRAAAALADAGREVVDATPPHQVEARRLSDALLGCELATTAVPVLREHRELLSRYGRQVLDGVGGFTPDLALYVGAACRLSELEADVDGFFDRHPIALCPVVPVPAPVAATGITTIDGEPARPGGKLTLCTYANVFGLPAASVPAGRAPDTGLPLAVQVIGRRGGDGDVLATAAQLEQLLGGYVDPDGSPASVTAPAGAE